MQTLFLVYYESGQYDEYTKYLEAIFSSEELAIGFINSQNNPKRYIIEEETDKGVDFYVNEIVKSCEYNIYKIPVIKESGHYELELVTTITGTYLDAHKVVLELHKNNQGSNFCYKKN